MLKSLLAGKILSASKTKTEPKGDSIDVLKSIGSITGLMGIYLLFSGWVYIFYYLDFFGISIREADIDYSQFVIYSYNSITWGYHAGVYKYYIQVILLVVLYVASYFTFRKRPATQLIFTIVGLCVLFPLTYNMSKTAGTRSAKYHMKKQRFKTIKFIFHESFMKHDSDAIKKEGPHFSLNSAQKDGLIGLNATGALTLVMSNKDKFFVIYYDPSWRDDKVPLVYCVKKDDLYATKIYLDDSTKKSRF